jgi:hypothetical protein
MKGDSKLWDADSERLPGRRASAADDQPGAGQEVLAEAGYTNGYKLTPAPQINAYGVDLGVFRSCRRRS